MAMAARMPMIATTIINSTSVNPFRFRILCNIFLPSMCCYGFEPFGT